MHMGLRHGAAADHRQAVGFGRGQGIHGHCGGGGGACGGQAAGIAQQQWLAGLHRHQQGPGGNQRALLADDIGRGFHPVHTRSGEYAQVIDKVASPVGELHQLLRGLHRMTGDQLAEQGDHGLVYIDLGQQLFGSGFIQHIRGGRHGRLRNELNN